MRGMRVTYKWLGGTMVRSRARDSEVVSSSPSLLFSNNPKQVIYTCGAQRLQSYGTLQFLKWKNRSLISPSLWKNAHLSSNSHNFWMQPNIAMKYAGYVAWILTYKHCKFGEKTGTIPEI